MKQFFSVPGKPRGKGRPRFDRRGHAYTPETTRDYERDVVRACRNAGMQAREGPVCVRVAVYWPIPMSWSRARREEAVQGILRPATKPDLDNIIKAIMDGMTLSGTCWHDDSQCVAIIAQKYYAAVPRVDVVLEDIDE